MNEPKEKRYGCEGGYEQLTADHVVSHFSYGEKKEVEVTEDSEDSNE